MFGCIVLGGLTALAIAKLWRHRHGGGWCRRSWYRGQGWGPGGHFEGDSFGPDFPGAGRRRRMGFALRFLSDRLEATPAQEKVIAQAVDDFRAEVEPLRQEGKKTRADLAAALRKSSIDEVLFGELFARHDEALEKGRKAFIGAAAKIHDALDERQRERLADIVERGPRWWGY
jgi:LTXXQ motif family protein